MKRIIAGAALSLALVLPNIALAHDGYYYRHGGGPIGFVGDLVALPFVAAGAVLGVAATVATAPFYAVDSLAQQAPAYYPQPAYYAPQAAYYPPRPVYYAPPAPRVYYAPPAPAYYAPPAYYQPRVVYRPYYPPAPVYYQQAPAGY